MPDSFEAPGKFMLTEGSIIALKEAVDPRVMVSDSTAEPRQRLVVTISSSFFF